MADKAIVDKAISDLTQAVQITNEDLFVLEQGGTAKKLKGSQVVQYAKDSVAAEVQGVKEYADTAKASADAAAKDATRAEAAAQVIDDKVAAADASAKAAASSAAAAAASVTGVDEKVQAAQTAADNATKSETAAKAAQTAAANAQKAAETAQTGAQNAKTAAESAQEAAESAKDAAAGSSTAAGQKATQAAQSAEDAAYAKSAAETAKTDAQAARDAIVNMIVEAVTLETGNPATVSKSLVDNVYKLVFGLPRGNTGATGPQGEKGDKGDAFTYSDFTAEQLASLKGDKGDTGPKGDKGDTGATGATGPANVLTIGSVTSGKVASATITGEAPNQVLNLVLEKGDKGDTGEKGATGDTGPQGEQGPQGETGEAGATGNGISSIELKSGTHAAGTTDIYEITFTDGTTFDFSVYNGANGTGAGDMLASTYDPQGKAQDIFAYADTKSEKSVAFTVTLSASGWINKTQTVSDARFLTSGYAYSVAPDSGSFTAYGNDVIYADNVTTDGQMQFHCSETPTGDLTVNVLRIEVSA